MALDTSGWTGGHNSLICLLIHLFDLGILGRDLFVAADTKFMISCLVVQDRFVTVIFGGRLFQIMATGCGAGHDLFIAFPLMVALLA